MTTPPPPHRPRHLPGPRPGAGHRFEARQPVYLPVVLREAWLGISLTELLGFVVGNRIRRS